jgi:DNA polymerase elongation subunit (family B)
MIISTFSTNDRIFLSWRENGEKKSEIKKFRPYFFVDNEHREIKSYKPSKYIKREFEYEEGEWYSLEGTKLKKVYVESSEDVKIAKDRFIQTWEADVKYHHRYAVDNLSKLPEYNMRKWYWDMEWQQGGEYHDCITTIVMYDNYDKDYYQWVWFPKDDNPRGKEGTIGRPYHRLVLAQKKMIDKEKRRTDSSLRVFNSEKDMIENFIGTMVVKDPDMLIAWFGLKFDLPKLIDRCCALGVNPLRLSPYAKVSNVFPTKEGHRFTKAEDGFSPISQPIGGRICLNLDLAFERQWNDSQRGTLPSLSLDYISETILGRNKLKSEKFPDPNEFYRRAWLEDTETYLQYALIDVELMVEIDESNYCSEAILALQRLLVAPFDACFYASHMGGIYFMRNATWKAPTGFRPKNKVCNSCGEINDKKAKVCKKCKESLSYQGAMVYDPLSENTNGLHKGVAAFDFAGLYPSMILARNISFETISDTPTEFGANLATPKDFSICDEKDMVYFKTDKLGLLPTAVLELKELRNQYKAKMKEAKGRDSEYVKWHNNQMAVKRLMASFYGILAFTGFGWSNVKLAESITASAREAIRSAAFKAKEMEV